MLTLIAIGWIYLSLFSNFDHLPELENADPRTQSGTIQLTEHSDWILAGWSVDTITAAQ